MRTETEERSPLLPPTGSQLAIWTGQALQPEEPLYNMVLAFRITGFVDEPAFREAFARLIDCADALRGCVEMHPGGPLFRYRSAMEEGLEFHDLTSAASPDRALAEWIEAARVRQLDLSRCLFHSALLRLALDRHVWYFNQHHLLTDAWSMGVLFEKLSSLYEQVLRGESTHAPLPDYADFVEFERKARSGTASERARLHWKAALIEPASPSAFYRRAPSRRFARTERLRVPLGPARTAALKTLARSPAFESFSEDLAQMQIFATVLFAWLYRITGKQALSVGTPAHNRVSPVFKRTAGLFIDMYPLQVTVEEGERFASLHQKVARNMRATLLNAQPGTGSLELNRAFDVVLNFITSKFGKFAGMPVESDWVHVGYGDRNHLLRLQVHDFDSREEFVLDFDLNVDAFSAEERARAAAHYLRILDALLADQRASIDRVPLVDEAERQTLFRFGRGAPCTVAPGTVLERFRRNVRRTPDATALECRGIEMSYEEIDRRSGALAERLIDVLGNTLGDRPGPVALLLPRVPDSVVAILAVLKSGRAYLPLDPAHPAERIGIVLADAGEPPLLTTRELCGSHASDARTLLLDEMDLDAVPAGGRVAEPRPSDTAYVIYTSGSTGSPKGVEVTHASLVNYLDWAQRYYLGSEPAVMPLFTSLAYDLAVTSVFLPLVSGGTTVLYPESRIGRELTIQRVIEENRVDTLKLTPAHLALMHGLDLSGSRLRRLIVGGEDLKAKLAASVHRRLGGRTALYNEYGPTEATVACMIHQFDPDRDRDASVPIGRPIDNLEIYVLDKAGKPAPRGVVGEIAIGGVGLARGYFNAPGLTAESFVEPGIDGVTRLYRTGDVARWREDAALEFLGRDDGQLKIRGVRVEIAEIEAALLQEPAIEQCTVIAREHRSRPAAARDEHCIRCGLSSRHPHARLNTEGICRVCLAFDEQRDAALAYFGTMEDLARIADDARAAACGRQDSIMLLSGGKDSTYALCRLVDLGLKPLVFTLDNGYISEGAKANIRRVAELLGLEVVVGSTEAMNEIFVDSLNRFSNVCNGCFKTIYTMSMQLARRRNIRYVFTGLSRGQIFETRLQDLFKQRIIDRNTIDRTIIEARKAYHRMDDAVSRRLDTAMFADDSVFEQIRFVDFYRYCAVSLDEVLGYLAERVPWIRPVDTGRSTNCLINDVGIYVHTAERGYHNYALPYSWDVRLGHKQRDAARRELDDTIDPHKVERILAQIGYNVHKGESAVSHLQLTAYYTGREASEQTLAASLKARLPEEFVPARFVHLERLPLTPNGKIDRGALPDAAPLGTKHDEADTQPLTGVARTLADVWRDILGVERVGGRDNFFDLGGDSILNIQIVTRARQLGIVLSPQQIFDHPTVMELASVAVHGPSKAAERQHIGERASSSPSTVAAAGISVKELDDVLDEFGEPSGAAP